MDIPTLDLQRVAEAFVYIGLIDDAEDVNMLKRVVFDEGNVFVTYTEAVYRVEVVEMQEPQNEVPSEATLEEAVSQAERDHLRRL